MENVKSLDGIDSLCLKKQRELTMNKSTINKLKEKQEVSKLPVVPKEKIDKSFKGDKGTITTKSLHIQTIEDAIKASKINLDVWFIERHIINSWEVTCKVKDSPGKEHAETFTNYQVKLWLKRKAPEILAIEDILIRLENKSPFVKKIKYPKSIKHNRKRILEVSVFDPHLGLHCFKGGSDSSWSIKKGKLMFMATIERILNRAEAYRKFYEYILFPFGNDFMHIDNVFGTTTQGTVQPEGDAWKYVYEESQQLIINAIEMLKLIAPVKILVVPGNHSRQSEFTMGHFLNAYYRNDSNVDVNASADPYKFCHYGVNLIGYEHGHSVNALRLAALMANETRLNGWRDARYCEWHIGDQHRKGSAKPSMFEEQGVSIEYLPSLTPPNEWHRVKGFNWQKRGGMGFIWDYSHGQVARIPVNIDNYTGYFLGEKE